VKSLFLSYIALASMTLSLLGNSPLENAIQPRGMGGFWIYDHVVYSEGGNRKAPGFTREDVIASAVVEGKTCYLVRLTIDWRSDNLRTLGIPLGEDDFDYFWEYYDETGSYNYAPDDDPNIPPESLEDFELTLTYPTKVGHTEEYLNEKWIVVALEEEITVPAGVFKCVVYEALYHMVPDEEPVSKTTFYMKPGVGAIRVEVYDRVDTEWQLFMQNNLREYSLTGKVSAAETSGPKSEAISPSMKANEYLSSGTFEEGIAFFNSQLSSEDATPSDRFSLAAMQFFKAVEGLAQDLHRFGLGNKSGILRQLPFIRMPVPENAEPEMATYTGIQAMLSRFQTGLKAVNLTLSELSADPFLVPIDINTVRMDLNGDGELGDDDYFHLIYARYIGGLSGPAGEDQAFPIVFDTGDGFWLKGYSHLLLAITDLQLAHDWERLFDLFAGYIFPGAGRPLPQMKRELNATGGPASMVEMSTLMYLMSFKVNEPQRLASAHKHLLALIECSRASMALYAAETDNEREWIPNTKQDSVTGARLDEDRVYAWYAFLDELESILTGDLLIPHWRIEEGHGINLKKVFMEPSQLDVILWVHGVGVLPYVEEGKTSEADTWAYIWDGFDGMFPAFAIWIN
jgi:hypothetical protein